MKKFINILSCSSKQIYLTKTYLYINTVYYLLLQIFFVVVIYIKILILAILSVNLASKLKKKKVHFYWCYLGWINWALLLPKYQKSTKFNDQFALLCYKKGANLKHICVGSVRPWFHSPSEKVCRVANFTLN